jgi:dipeptidyl-peptidase-4
MFLHFILSTVALCFSLCLYAEKNPQSKKTFVTPFLQNLEGWPVEWNPIFKKKENNKIFKDVKKALANHLQRITYILEEKKVNQLRKLAIRVDLDHELGNMQYHPSKGWLTNNNYDPSLEKRVHIPRARQLLSRDQWAKHPYVILHELAHSYHDQVLSFEHKEIIAAYQRAEKEGLYERVLLFRGGKTRHYARTNHKEFFAEMTESYLGVNDFFPFVRAELQEHDPETYNLMQKIWGKI